MSDDLLVQRQIEVLAEEAFRRGFRLQIQADFAGAEHAYRHSIALHPTPEAHTFLGWTFSLLGRFEEAIAECRDALALDPSFGNAYSDIGSYLLRLGRPEEAIPWLRRAREVARTDSPQDPLCTLGRALEMLGRVDEARAAYLEALRLEPGCPPAEEGLRRLGAGREAS